MSNRNVPVHANVVGLVQVGRCENNISRALQTCVSSGINKVSNVPW
jgi:hypothetical protein